MIFQPEIETMGREEMRALQLQRLQQTVRYVYERVPLYRERLDALKVRPEDIRSLDDVRRLPFTTKEDFRANYPYGLFAVPMKDIVRIHASSGTTGQPTVVGYTEQDIDMWATCVARLCAAGGATREDIAQISFGYGLFTGALGLHFGLAKLGAAVVPISSGNTERQIQLMADFGSTVLVATPSYALYMAEVAERMGMMDKIQLRVGLFGAEGSTEEMRAELERRWGIVATENYGMSELIGPGVSGDCTEKCGMHINEDYFYCEVVDPATGEPVPEGEWGELVVTPLMKQALPLLRYRTHDITRLLPGPCKCGRTTTRMQKIAGRTDDMLIIRGVNVFPSQIEGVLIGMEGIGPHYEIVVTKKGYMDQIEVKVELVDAALLNSYGELEALTRRIHDRLKVVLQIDAKVTLVSPNTLKRFEGKAKRVTDLR
ncbi:MAG TPA: phenylacetate--CoA ligase [Candidatus Spyradocola merdavium]|nr:phenylacetate--CoA ligase [Candidatus Spyradocola merdavium]